MLDIFVASALGCIIGYAGMEAILWAWKRHRPGPVKAEAPPLPLQTLSANQFATIGHWAQMNPWYLTDLKLNYEAMVLSNRISIEKPHLSLEENLKLVTETMRQRHPEIVASRH